MLQIVNMKYNLLYKILHTLHILPHIWEFRKDKGEEEHGNNPAIRYCKLCNKQEHAFYCRFGDVRIQWRDLNKELDKF